MNNNVMKLIQVRFRNQFGFSKLLDKNTSTRTHALLTTIGYLAAYILVLVYVVTLTYQMQMKNQIEFVNPYIFSLLFWTLGIWTLLSGVKNILIGLDHDQIFVLPIEKWQAKLLNIFSQLILQWVICISVLFALQIALFFINPFPLVNLLIVGMYALVIPLLAIGCSISISLLVKGLVTFLKIKNTLVAAILTLLIFISPMLYGYTIESTFNAKSGIINTSFLRYSLLETISLRQWINTIAFVVVTILAFILLCFIIQKRYNLLTQLVGEKAAVIKQVSIEINSTLLALLKKEIRQYVSSFSYVINTILAPCALLVVGVGLAFEILPSFPSIEIDMLGLTLSNQFIYYVIFLACATLTTTTSCSFSFEGKKVWIIQSLPISISELSIAKAILNILLFIPGLIITIIDCWYVFGLRGVDFIGHATLLIVSMLFISVSGLFLNLKFPNYNWINEIVVVKQGLATIFTAIISMGLITMSALLLVYLGIYGVFILLIVEILVISSLAFMIKRIGYL